MIIIHLINRNKEKVHTVARETIKDCEIALCGFSVDLILIHGIEYHECKPFTECILKPIVVQKKGVIIFLGDKPLEEILHLWR